MIVAIALFIGCESTEQVVDHSTDNQVVNGSEDGCKKFYNLGMNYQRSRLWVEAAEFYQKAITCSTDYIDAYIAFGNMYEDLDSTSAAEQVWIDMQTNNPEAIESYTHYGAFLADQGRYDESEQAFLKAHEICPDNPTPILGLADVLTQQEKFDQYERTIAGLQATISNFEEYARKLNIMAGLKSSETLNMEAGIGSSSSSGQFLNTDPLPQSPNLNQLQDISKRAGNVEQNLSTLFNYFGDKAIQMAYTPSIKPVNGYISSPYGMRDDPFTGKRQMHWGIDIVTAEGNPVASTADGLIIKTAYDKISGNYVKISHRITGYVTIYCHLSEISVKTGQKVKRGQTIGLVGHTGKALGSHVHYEVQLDGKAKNPWYYLLEE